MTGEAKEAEEAEVEEAVGGAVEEAAVEGVEEEVEHWVVVATELRETSLSSSYDLGIFMPWKTKPLTK